MRRARPRPRLAWLALLCSLAAPVSAASSSEAFDEANKLYEQGKYGEAASAYENLIRSGHGPATLFYNLGNARFKAGETGRAIAAYLQAERLAPRDPSLRFNLQFVRKQVAGADAVPAPWWARWLASLTLNEWTVLAVGVWWIWCILLALRELRPTWRKGLRGYTATAGFATLFLAANVSAAAYQQSSRRVAVVVAPQAVVRTGPLEDSKVLHQFRDGVETIVLDEKSTSIGDQRETWLQVQDSVQRTGWLKREDVLLPFTP